MVYGSDAMSRATVGYHVSGVGLVITMLLGLWHIFAYFTGQYRPLKKQGVNRHFQDSP